MLPCALNLNLNHKPNDAPPPTEYDLLKSEADQSIIIINQVTRKFNINPSEFINRIQEILKNTHSLSHDSPEELNSIAKTARLALAEFQYDLLEREVNESITIINQVTEEFNVNPSEFRDRIQEILTNNRLLTLLYDSPEELNSQAKTARIALAEFQNEWPFKYISLQHLFSHHYGRIQFAYDTLQLSPEDRKRFTTHEELAKNLLGTLVDNLKEQQSDNERLNIIINTEKKLKDLRGLLDLDSLLPDTRNKIIARTNDIKQTFQDLNFEEEQKQVNEIIEASKDLLRDLTPDNPKKRDLILKTQDQLELVDIEIEKRIAKREIKHRFEQLKETAEKCKGNDIYSSLDLTTEERYAENSLHDSEELLDAIRNPISIIGMNKTSQLFIATSGTLNTLSRIHQDIYIKYCEHRIEKKLKFFFHTISFEGISPESIKKLENERKKLRELLKKELTWGPLKSPGNPPCQLPNNMYVADPKEASKGNDPRHLGMSPPANIPPPLLPFPTLDAIVDAYSRKIHDWYTEIRLPQATSSTE